MARPKPWYVIIGKPQKGKGLMELVGIGPFPTEQEANIEGKKYPTRILTQTPPDTLTIVRPLVSQR